MRITNYSALEFWGNALVARLPVRVVVMGEEDPAMRSRGAVAQLYASFSNFVRASETSHHSQSASLADGTRVRMVHNMGMDTIFVEPVSTPVEVALDDWFHTIPTSDTYLAGTSTTGKVSSAWEVPGNPSDWASVLKDTRTLDDHPGHVTWCNPDLLVGEEQYPIVLSWRGPRDRYASTTGWSDVDGGTVVAHEKDPYSFPSASTFASSALKDTGYVWINGRRVDTGFPKLIAACLCEPAPISEPGKYVLRAIFDDYSGARQMVCRDLVAAPGLGSNLELFLEADSLIAADIYVATNNTNDANGGGASTTPGDWDYHQRPHFNKSGTRVALLATVVQSDGIARDSAALSFDPTTWTVDDYVAATKTGTGSNTGYASGVPWTETITEEQQFFFAADFDGDTFVYMTLTQSRDAEIEARDGGDQYENYAVTETYTVEHSVLGVLATWDMTSTYATTSVWSNETPSTVDFAFTESLSVTNGTGSGNGIVGRHPFFAFSGDISQRFFAIGYPDGTASFSFSRSQSGTYSRLLQIPIASTSATSQEGRLLFDVYWQGSIIATATTGEFTNAAASPVTLTVPASSVDPNTPPANIPDSPFTITNTTDTGGQFARGDLTSPPSFEGKFGNPLDGGSFRAPSYSFTPPPLYQHCAVHPLKRAAYVACAYFERVYHDDAVTTGLELALVVPTEGGSATIATLPAYVTGTNPTMSVPVFTGVGEE